MDITNFNANDRVYRRIENGSPVDFVHLKYFDDDPEEILYLTNTHRSFASTSPTVVGDEKEFTIEFPENISTYSLRKLTLADIQEYFEGYVRTFNDPEIGEKYLRRALLDSRHAPQVEEDASGLSVTFSEDGEALELTREDEEGNLFYRDEEDWVEVTDPDSMPTIFDKRYISIEREDSDAIVALWDESMSSGEDLFEEDITPFAALKQ